MNLNTDNSHTMPAMHIMGTHYFRDIGGQTWLKYVEDIAKTTATTGCTPRFFVVFENRYLRNFDYYLLWTEMERMY